MTTTTTLATILCINWRMAPSAAVTIEVAPGTLPPVLGAARLASNGKEVVPLRISSDADNAGGWRFVLPGALVVADAIVISAV